MRSKKRTVRYFLLTANLLLLAAVVWFVSQGSISSNAVNSSSVVLNKDEEITDPLDKLSSADIAVHVARITRLDESVAVVNHADSVNAQLSVAPAEEMIVAKPQIVTTSLKSKKDIVIYVSVEGDTVASVAQKYNVTSDSIRWSNRLTGDSIAVGTELAIPPVNGIVYTVKEGDTVDSLANRYNVNRAKLIEMNDAEINGLVVGERIILPDGIQPVVRTFYSGGYGGGGSYTPAYGPGNGYDYGWCTWHAANRRQQSGNPLPSNLGNAISWYSLAQRAGLSVGSAPRAGAVLWHANMGGLGHVAYVESVNPDGSILVSDMNYPYWGRVTTRTVTPDSFGSYRFIY